MEPLLAYLLKSTICISVLYLVFRWTLKKETLFALSRYLLLAILLFSLAIPIIKLPELFPQTIDVKVLPEQRFHAMPNMEDVAVQITTIPTTHQASVSTERSISIKQITTIVYAIGVLALFISLLIALAKIGLLLLNTKVYKRRNYNIALVDGAFSPMSFGKFIIMSKQDYKDHRKEILKHELAHIQFKHTYDLILVELIKLFHWFNPLVYQLRNDLKEIQEFQVDRHLIQSGINSKEYQLLLIKKCVGAERYALANSFNHCQIKNRIVMMNNSNNSKGKSWKVAIFLPIAALMLMAFGNKKGEIPIDESQKEQTTVYNSENKSSNFKLPTESEWRSAAERFKAEITSKEKIWTEADFGRPDASNAVRGFLGRSILINSDFEVVVNGKKNDWDEVSKQIWESMDYNSTTSNLKEGFEKTVIDDKEIMVQKYVVITVFKDISTPKDIYQNFLNFIGNEVTKIRQKYAIEIYKNSYNQLAHNQKNNIDKVVPAIITFHETPILDNGFSTNDRTSVNIEVRAEGIYILPDKNVITLQEMEEKVKEYAKKQNRWMVDVKIAAGLNEDKVSKIKSVLEKYDNLGIRYLDFDPVYITVENMARFSGGDEGVSTWLHQNVKYPEKAITDGISGKVYVSFIVNSKGKVVFPKVIRGLSPELDNEALIVLSKMPNWQPATQNGTPVSVSYTVPIKFTPE